MKTRENRWGAFLVVLAGASMVHAAATDPPAITYTGDGSDSQEVSIVVSGLSGRAADDPPARGKFIPSFAVNP